mmetsp:Transcript_23360/g.23296  ORF Transcript_23360/g.23296 Transcript_23360/m.23296 type:complete len:171 (+) Transcript_23360:15-527(+)
MSFVICKKIILALSLLVFCYCSEVETMKIKEPTSMTNNVPTDMELYQNNLDSSPQHRYLSKIGDELKDTKASPKNGVKVLVLLLLVALTITLCLYVNKKLRNYIDNDNSVALTQARQGPFKMLTKNSFVRFKDEETEESVVLETEPEKRFEKEDFGTDIEKSMENTKRKF